MTGYFEQYKRSEVIETNRVIHTPSAAAKKMFFYIQEAGYLKSLKPHLGQRSGLDSYLYLIVLSGSGTISYDGVSYEVSAQDCFLLDCRRSYSHLSSSEDPWELMWLHFNGPEAQSYFQYTVNKNSHCFRTIYLSHITEAIQRLILLHSNSLESADLEASYLITQILTLSVLGCERQTSSNSSMQEKLRQIHTYLNEHFREPITLDLLSERFFISKYHLAREFKKEYSQTIIQYLLGHRINYAKELLRFTDLSISEIARQCGIRDVNYFNKVFRKIEGGTASEFRKKW